MELPKRKLGKTGVDVTILSLGGKGSSGLTVTKEKRRI